MENNINNPTPQIEETPKAKKPINAKLIIIIVAIVAIIAAAGIGVAVGTADKDGQKSGNKSDVEAAEKGDSDKGNNKNNTKNDTELMKQAVDTYLSAYYGCDKDAIVACYPEIMWERTTEYLNEEMGESFADTEEFIYAAQEGYAEYYEFAIREDYGDFVSLDYEFKVIETRSKDTIDEANNTLKERNGLKEDVVEKGYLVQYKGKVNYTEGSKNIENVYMCVKVDGEWYLMDGFYYFAAGDIVENYYYYNR